MPSTPDRTRLSDHLSSCATPLIDFSLDTVKSPRSGHGCTHSSSRSDGYDGSECMRQRKVVQSRPVRDTSSSTACSKAPSFPHDSLTE